MISREAQYRIYAGTKKDDFTGWEKVKAGVGENVEVWTLDIGNGYFLDRKVKTVKGLFGTKVVKTNIIRRDRSIMDPGGDYCDTDFFALADVELKVSEESISFKAKDKSSVILSREPIDWDGFSKGAPEFGKEKGEENWFSFYC
jgi:hypothetical protein